MKKIYILFIFLITKLDISFQTSILLPIVKIYSEELFEITCDSHFFYLSMKISSDKDIEKTIPFELSLISPSNLKMKCLIIKNYIKCFSFVPDGAIFRQEELFFHIFYSPPKVNGIEFDIKSFVKNSRKWENTTTCGNFNYLLNDTKVDINEWKNIIVNDINGGECIYLYEDKQQKNIFYFNMSLNIQDENLIKYLEENNEANILFLQEIKAPIIIQYQQYMNSNFITTKDYVLCANNELINKNNYKEINCLCKLKIPKKSILNSVINFNSFFDKIYIQKINLAQNLNEIQTMNVFINASKIITEIIMNKTITRKEYFSLNDGYNNNILCPNFPIFNIKNKNSGIYYDSYNNKTNRFTFYLKGILTNGYKYVNNSLIKLSLTTDEISFNLFLADNSLDDFEEIQANCILSSSTHYNEEDNLIKCIGNKAFYNNINKNILIDMNLNYVQNKNNILNNIIINWPDKSYFGNKKNFFSVKIYALSIKRKYSVCEDGNFFTFYINIYDINKELKIIFDLPLLEPKGYVSTCELFDHLTLVCTIDLRYKKILKNEKISLPEKDKEIRIINEEGNEIIFMMNDQNNYIKLDEDCGENIVFGAMKEIGISKKNGIIISISLIIFLLLIIGFCIFYIIHCILRCKNRRGKKLPMTEESKVQKEGA